MSISIEQRVFRIAAEILEVPRATLARDSSPQTIPAWDATALAMILDRLSQSLRIEFPPESIQSLHNLGDIIDLTDELSFGRGI